MNEIIDDNKELFRKKIDVLFIIPPYHHRNGSGSFFPLGISSIIAYLETQGYSWDYIDCTQIINSLDENSLLLLERILPGLLRQYDPEIIGIGPCVTPSVKGLEVVARHCIEQFGIERVFAGGPFASLPSQDWFFFEHLKLKYLIKGEGEAAVCRAVNTLKAGGSLSECDAVSISGRPVLNKIKDLDSLPFPRRLELESNKLSDRRRSDYAGFIHNTSHESTASDNAQAYAPVAQIVASRGCPYRCAYCVSGNLKELSFRKRSPHNIVEEMKMLSSEYGVKDIVFYDDCFFTSAMTVHNEIEKFCEAVSLAQLDSTWQIEIRPDIITEISNSEFQLLEGSGCRQMNVGVERTDKNGAEAFGKPYNFIQLKDTIQRIHQCCNIKVTGTFILGGKDQTTESVREMIRRSKILGLDDAEYSPLFVYPDTPIYQEVFKTPRDWLTVVLSDTEPWGEVVYENEQLQKRQLIDLMNEAYEHFHSCIQDVYDEYVGQSEHNGGGERETCGEFDGCNGNVVQARHSHSSAHISDRYNLRSNESKHE